MIPAERINALFDYAANKLQGFTLQEAAHSLGYKRRTMEDTIWRLRKIFGDSDTINLVCDPNGYHEPWLYRLVGTLEEAKPWLDNRIGDCEGRIETTNAIAKSILAATDGRTLEGKSVRAMVKALTRLIEDLADLRNDSTTA